MFGTGLIHQTVHLIKGRIGVEMCFVVLRLWIEIHQEQYSLNIESHFKYLKYKLVFNEKKPP